MGLRQKLYSSISQALKKCIRIKCNENIRFSNLSYFLTKLLLSVRVKFTILTYLTGDQTYHQFELQVIITSIF